MANDEEFEDCPDCQNQGWYADYDRNGEVVQVQCEFCWTNPRSKFNASNTAWSRLVEEGTGNLPAVVNQSESESPA